MDGLVSPTSCIHFIGNGTSYIWTGYIWARLRLIRHTRPPGNPSRKSRPDIPPGNPSRNGMPCHGISTARGTRGSKHGSTQTKKRGMEVSQIASTSCPTLNYTTHCVCLPACLPIQHTSGVAWPCRGCLATMACSCVAVPAWVKWVDAIHLSTHRSITRTD